ncbi:MarR family winged helix-turn-helix transcriptional regulator [Streptomyces sp. NBC_01190]|uniref:MarR family winged helix-turn-helix transcriptional regulator n=1 Tax=Streptomyces sp. NBC_01190 TaxID=2903767 RepID=UPI003863CDD5|nr:MarR family transcriptional regulator [Streptomyces sp. NBC_01190]
MDEEQISRLFELADLILAVGRHIQASKEAEAESGTPLEGAVMRYIDRHPGGTASAAAEATQLISSNFSRAIRRLEQAGFVRREVDAHDARRVRLYPTEKAQENLQRLHEAWSRLLEEAVTDSDDIDAAISTLRNIETRLVARTRPGAR